MLCNTYALCNPHDVVLTLRAYLLHPSPPPAIDDPVNGTLIKYYVREYNFSKLQLSFHLCQQSLLLVAKRHHVLRHLS